MTDLPALQAEVDTWATPDAGGGVVGDTTPFRLSGPFRPDRTSQQSQNFHVYVKLSY